MWKVKDIFRHTIGRNNKERKYSKNRKPIMLLDDGTPIYPMTAREGRELGKVLVDGFVAGIEQHKQTVIGIDWGNSDSSFSATVTVPYKRNSTK
ncbi:hypothetical protein ACS2QR_16950 [Bacillus cereus group sp. Bce026]|uniref:hypothetical protein n=1 Tax=Bacillus cereus group sp. Bce026 TaxID=3445242 RepID=UPI003F1FB2A9